MTNAPIWRLRNAHYLNVPGTEWEHTETSRETGKRARKLFAVPALLDPNDPNDCDRNGDCLVYNLTDGIDSPRESRFPGCHEFIGDPTPEMEPMNPEAEAISESFRGRWEHPIETLPVNGGMSTEEQVFMEKMMKTFGGAVQAQNQTVSQADYDALKADLEALKAAITGSASQIPVPAAIRKV